MDPNSRCPFAPHGAPPFVTTIASPPAGLPSGNVVGSLLLSPAGVGGTMSLSPLAQERSEIINHKLMSPVKKGDVRFRGWREVRELNYSKPVTS
jgi:hypothetical protein